MNRLRALLLAASMAVPLAPALAEDPTVVRSGELMMRTSSPAGLTSSERANYREVFGAIRAGRWAEAHARLDSVGQGPLHNAARAEIYLAKDSPRVELEQIMPLLSAAPEMPHAAKLARLAETRADVGTKIIPTLPALACVLLCLAAAEATLNAVRLGNRSAAPPPDTQSS